MQNNMNPGTVTSELTVGYSDLQCILIWQYINAANEYHDMILHLENRNSLIEQSVTLFTNVFLPRMLHS